MKCMFAIIAGCALALPALGQTIGLQNGGFETQCLFCGGPFPDGWHSPGNNLAAIRRSVGDGSSPAFQPVGTPGALTPHSGIGVASIGTSGSGGFVGLTTDTVNFCYCDQTCNTACPGPYPFFDPYFDYNAGDVVVTGWYMIPANAPITGDVAGMRIDIKVGFQDVASKEVYNVAAGGITGDTNGEWRPFSLTFLRSDIQAIYDCNTGVTPNCGCACVPLYPLPDHAKITIGRYAPDGTPTSGTIYWDDITYTQLPAGGGCSPTCDYNQDGGADTSDVIDLANDIASGTESFPGSCADYNQDGGADTTDVIDLANDIASGNC